MNHNEQRKNLRAILAESKCILPAAVHDPISARVAESVGYEVGVLWGSAAAHITLAMPDLILITLTECVEQVRRITRAAELSLIVDADHGYGNALNVMRTVQELEHAGASALTIEDTVLPTPFGHAGERESLTSIEECAGRVRAAIAARSDASLVIMARTGALKIEGLAGAIARTKAYTAAGADVIQIAAGLEKLEELDAFHAATPLPLVVGLVPPAIRREDLAARGVRISHQGQQPLFATVKALQETYAHLYQGGAPADLKSKIATPQDMERLVKGDLYKTWQQEYLR